MGLADLDQQQLDALAAGTTQAYAELQERGLSLDLTRGKPSAAQLDLSDELLTLPGAGRSRAADGTDVRNYGGQKGLPEIRAIFAELLGVEVDQLLAGDNSSLSLMHDTISWAVLHGVPGGDGPWFGRGVKFICPVPGYDRHFSILSSLGIEMVPVALGEHGPDVAEIAALVAADESIKGIWVVPTYANPTGAVYDEATTRALLEMPAAPDFRVFWDNAYALHHLTDTEHPPLDVLGLAEQAGHPDRVLVFASTSKISYAGAGVSFLASSPANLTWYLDHAAKRSIGPDKLNHLRHALWFRDADGVRRVMRRHRELLEPKFALVRAELERRLGGLGIASWTEPEGGYFVSLDVPDGTASRVVALARAAGIALTPAGASFPGGHDPRDRNIRIAPSFPPEAELAVAMEGLTTCVLLAALEQQGVVEV
ncbi:aminotransferase class I/II-fold pyridoxal phosphate-dependent enzyme [Auraticoccus monumenti]|uniref:DNA-binding transcriptional regulator, MocR family, contains an aminotransferase domain n=1 Tax=Auraticoccus monumenti TaxID=675864 RepID=A0A1G6WYW1_9ACTN|nr:aminotransferase class I/II-fold pyridoxal phosphate-dependent enzyme [Auraticoccus monumenti]SDD71102.1 DNA-binding transcriptional regulator, MocR family, contains an aminotransferase domain [Auraticoccus monumenti]